MRDDAKADDLVEQLRGAFAESIREAGLGLPGHQAFQLADALCRVQLDVLAGLRVTYRAPAALDVEAVEEDWRQGKTLSEIMEKYGISRSSAYKHHPNKNRRARTG